IGKELSMRLTIQTQREKENEGRGQLRLRRFLSFRFGGLAALAERFFATLGAARIALGLCDDINDDTAVVLATFRARAVREAQFATFAGGKLRALDRMVRTPLGGLGS